MYYRVLHVSMRLCRHGTCRSSDCLLHRAWRSQGPIESNLTGHQRLRSSCTSHIEYRISYYSKLPLPFLFPSGRAGCLIEAVFSGHHRVHLMAFPQPPNPPIPFVALSSSPQDELVATEAVFSGLLGELSPEEAVALMSALVFQVGWGGRGLGVGGGETKY